MSDQCKRMVQELNADVTKWTIRQGSLPSPNPGNTRTRSIVNNGVVTRVLGGTITIDPNNIPAIQSRLGIPVNAGVVVGHELGHAMGNLILGRMGNTPPAGMCGESCATLFENLIRRDAGMTLRP